MYLILILALFQQQLTGRALGWEYYSYFTEFLSHSVICLDMTVNVNWHYSNKTELNWTGSVFCNLKILKFRAASPAEEIMWEDSHLYSVYYVVFCLIAARSWFAGFPTKIQCLRFTLKCKFSCFSVHFICCFLIPWARRK